MKRLLQNVSTIQIIGSTDLHITDVCFDSRQVIEGSLFIAVRGTQSDGHKFIDIAVEKGAVAILCEQLPEKMNEQVCYVLVKDRIQE